MKTISADYNATTEAGHIRLTLCRPERPEHTTVTKSQKPLWRYARQLAWGDAWEPAGSP